MSRITMVCWLFLIVWLPMNVWAQPVDRATEPTTATDVDEPLAEVTPPPPEPDRPVLSLEQARVQLREKNTAMQITEQAIIQAESMEEQAFAIWYPMVNVTAVYILNDQEISLSQPNMFAALGPYLQSVYNSDPALQAQLAAMPPEANALNLAQMPGSEMVVQNRHDARLIGTVTQTLFNYRAFPLLKLARTQVEYTQAAQENTLYELDAAVIQLYFNAVTFQRLRRVSARNVELARINYSTALAKLEEGVGLKFEVNRARVALSSAERERENAHLAYDLALDSLATLLETDEEFDVEEPPELSPPEGYEELVSEAVERRASIRRDQLAAELEEGWSEEIDSRFWPVVRAQFQTFLQRESAFGGDPWRWNLQLTASWDLYDGGFKKVESIQREATRIQKELQAQRTQQDVEASVRQAYLSIRTEQRKVSSAQAEVELATENVELTEAARELDAATQVDVELAQRQRYLAELALATAQVQLQAKLYQLLHLAGR